MNSSSPNSAPSAPPRENPKNSVPSVSSANSVLIPSAPFHQNLPRPSLNRALTSPTSGPARPFEGSRSNPFLAPASAFNNQTDFYCGLPHDYPLLLVEEAAGQLQCSDQHIRNLVDEGALLAFPINAEANDLKRRRRIFRIVRQTCLRDSRLTASGAADLIAAADRWLYSPSLGARAVLTVFESATALRCTGEHIRALYDAGHLKAVDISRQPTGPMALRITRASLTTFVQTRLAAQNNL